MAPIIFLTLCEGKYRYIRIGIAKRGDFRFLATIFTNKIYTIEIYHHRGINSLIYP
jgi:hypothetical protein